MTTDAQPKLPPLRVARAVDSLRRRLRRFERQLQPPSASVLELISTAWVAQNVYTATKLGISKRYATGLSRRIRWPRASTPVRTPSID